MCKGWDAPTDCTPCPIPNTQPPHYLVQIAPFDVDFAVTDIDLDFTHMREHMRRLMSGETSLFALNSANAVVKMLGGAGPRVLTYQVRRSASAVQGTKQNA